MAEFWLISAPGEKTCQQTWETINNLTSKQNSLSTNHKFHIPDLKVGTLDILVGLSDELGKVDTYCESVARKVAAYLGDVLEDQKDKLHENLLANGNDLVMYLTRFQWDMAQYPTKQNLKNIVDYIANKMTKIDADLKMKASAYNSIKGNLQTLERKSTGSLLTRGMAGLVKKDDFVHQSEYLVTLLVVVPKPYYRNWYLQYESLTAMVVPRSSKLIYEDADNGLFTVTLFQKIVDEYKRQCREHKFIVRDFVYNEEELIAGKNELSKLESDRKKEFGTLVRWLKVNFSEAFTAWIHVKALRVFVESVLRYGLPVNFQAVLLQPHKRSVKRLREVLAQLYDHLDSSRGNDIASADEMMDIPGLCIGEVEPYVLYKINVDMVDTGSRNT